MFDQLPAPTHRPVDSSQLMSLIGPLDAASDGGQLTAAQIEAVAAEVGVDSALAYMAMGMYPMLQVKREHPTCFTVCSGRCQFWGSHDLIVELLRRKAERLGAGKGAFDVMAQGCLDQCNSPVAMRFNGPAGQGVLPGANSELLDAVIAELCD